MKKLIHIPTLRTYRGFFQESKSKWYADRCLDDPHFKYIYCFDDKGIEWFSFIGEHIESDFYKNSYIEKRKEEFMWIEEE